MPGVRHIYLSAEDLDAMRRFYGWLLALEEIYYSAEEQLLAFDCDGLQFTIYGADVEPTAAGWATQPGWSGGTETTVSWSVELPEDDFRAAVDRLVSAGVVALHDEPLWVGYWSFPVRDPMGNTVEVTWPEPSDAETRIWSG
ncbi:MAG: VOC family protein [Actinomycetota bacterium]